MPRELGVLFGSHCLALMMASIFTFYGWSSFGSNIRWVVTPDTSVTATGVSETARLVHDDSFSSILVNVESNETVQ
jgi:hypothetical protein